MASSLWAESLSHSGRPKLVQSRTLMPLSLRAFATSVALPTRTMRKLAGLSRTSRPSLLSPSARRPRRRKSSLLLPSSQARASGSRWAWRKASP